MRIFVTGGTGFIGSHFLAAALNAGHEVVAMRRKPDSGSAVPLPHQPLWIERKLGELTLGDLNGCDVVVHLASAGVSPKRVPWQALVEVNVVGSAHLIATAYAADICRVVAAGTCHEYGDSATRYVAIPADAPLEPLSLYGASKAATYQLLSAFARVHSIELFYGRIFSAYGEGQFEENFWPSLRAAALTGQDFPMTNGHQIRDFIPVEAVASKLLDACHRKDLKAGEPCTENIGTGQPLSLRAFAEQEWKRFGATGQLLPGSLPDRPEDVQRIVPILSNH
jgi:nucleoside-diphosphate-sugar epimerase